MRSRILISHEDFARISDCFAALGIDPRKHFDQLTRKLEAASQRPAHMLPPDVVTLGATVGLREHDSDESFSVTITLPEDIDVEEHRISVLSQLGTVLLGERKGTTVMWPAPAGTIRADIEHVFAPRVGAHALLAAV
jgi:regulator of nucleoside diphosphate kinase